MIRTETLTIGKKTFIRTYSDAGRYVVGGSPKGAYAEAIDPAEFHRTYIEGDPIPPGEIAAEAEEITNILLGNS